MVAPTCFVGSVTLAERDVAGYVTSLLLGSNGCDKLFLLALPVLEALPETRNQVQIGASASTRFRWVDGEWEPHQIKSRDRRDPDQLPLFHLQS